MNVLITSASRKVSLVRAFQSALRRAGRGNVIAVDMSPYGPALYAADRRFLVGPSTNPDFIEQILAICEREKVALVIPTRDEELLLFAEAQERFSAARIRVMVPQSETVRICSDKLAFISFCREHAFEVPRTFEHEKWNSSDLPLFVKPRFGKGGKGARVVRSEQELHCALNRPDPSIIQEYVDWPEYTVDLLANFEGRVLSVVPRLREMVIAGESYVSRTVNAPELIAESSRLAAALHLVGHNTIQCFWNGERIKFIEINPRFGGAAALSMAAGADTPEMLIRLVKGETVEPCVGQFEGDLTMLRFTEDIFLKRGDLVPEISDSRVSHLASESRPGTGLRAIVFDLDNTLYPEEQFVVGGFRAVARLLAARGHLEEETLLKRMLHILHMHGRGRVFNILLEELEIDSGVWLPTLIQVYRSHRPVLALFPQAAGVLRALKDRGLRLGLVTDGLASMQRKKISALGLESYMDAIVCTGELGQGRAKPSPVPFEVALNLLEVSPGAAAYVADDISKDFAGPNRLGMKSVQVRSTGLVGVKQKPRTSDRMFEPQMTAGSLGEAVALLGLD